MNDLALLGLSLGELRPPRWAVSIPSHQPRAVLVLPSGHANYMSNDHFSAAKPKTLPAFELFRVSDDPDFGCSRAELSAFTLILLKKMLYC
jgi:hypothetical protein